jgi:hypothetical protein
LTPEQQAQLHDGIAPHLDAIKRFFGPGANVTLHVRSPHLPGDTTVVLTDDNIDDVIADLQRHADEIKSDTVTQAREEATRRRRGRHDFPPRGRR